MSRLRFRFQTVEFGDDDIHVRSLRDLQQFSDDQGAAESLGISSAQWSLFGVLWASSFVLADLMAGFPVGTRRGRCAIARTRASSGPTVSTTRPWVCGLMAR